MFADAFRLRFTKDVFDIVWWAQRFMSQQELQSVLREARRIVLPRGLVAVLDNDALQDLILPWPLELEMVVRHARLAEAHRRGQSSMQPGLGRHLQDLFVTAGLIPCDKRTCSLDRRWPLQKADADYFHAYFHILSNNIRVQLHAEFAQQLKRLIDQSSNDYLPKRSDFEMTKINVLFRG